MPKIVEQVRKLTAKVVMGGNPDIEIILKAADKRMDLFTLYGIARRVKPDVGENGKDFVRFYGEFEATNLETGQVFAAGQCILPGAAQDALFGAMTGAEVSDAQFAIKVGVKYDKTAATKYVYTVESLLPPNEASPMSMLKKQIQNLLPAPKKKSA